MSGGAGNLAPLGSTTSGDAMAGGGLARPGSTLLEPSSISGWEAVLLPTAMEKGCQRALGPIQTEWEGQLSHCCVQRAWGNTSGMPH